MKFQIIIFVFAAFFYFACDPTDKEESLTYDASDSVEVENVQLFIETSASMAGYFKKDAEFKTIVSDLSAKIHNNIQPLSIYFIADSIIQYSKDINQFSSDIATTSIATQKSSEIHKIIEEIAGSTDSTTVSVFISDCILSYPEEDIRRNPEINRYEAPNSLKNSIFSTFSDLRKRNFAASIYSFTSKFYGTYYNYRNERTTLNGEVRPFYVWIIGNSDILDDFNEELANISTFRPEEFLHFGLGNEVTSDFEIFTQIGRTGNWGRDGPETIEGIENSDTFWLGLSLEDLPSYAQSTSYLQENLVVDSQGCNVTLDIKDKSTINEKPRSTRQLEAYENSTHILSFTVEEIPLEAAAINFHLPLKYDNWYRDWSTDDDTQVKELGNRTFAFEHLVNGVIEAYETNNNYYINATIHLKK